MSTPKPANPPQRVVLDGRYVRLEPLTMAHAPDLFEASDVADGDVRFAYLGDYAPKTQADTEPAPPQDLVTYAAHVMGIAPPAEVPFETAEMTPMARSFYSDNKRVSSKRVLEALGADLLYPTYREGLDAIWKGRA